MDLAQVLLLFIPLLISLTVHEAGHALVAYWGGDRTAYLGGQVSLNPVPHVKREPFGMVILPLIAIFMSQGQWTIGFASTPIDPLWAQAHPRRAALMALAGPVANLLLAALAFALLKVLKASGMDLYGPGTGAVVKIALMFLTLNVLLMVFNLIPIPPLDGASVLEGLLPRQIGPLLNLVRATPMFGIIGIVAAWKLMDVLYPPARDFVLGML